MVLKNKQISKIALTLIGLETKDEYFERWNKFLCDDIPFDNDNFLDAIEEEFPEIIDQFENKIILNYILEKIEKWQKQNINFLLLGESKYPASLRNIHQPPTILFYKGNWKEDYDYNNSVAIVGSRKADITQSKFAHDLAFSLSENGICVVSGLALGIDAASHSGAIKPNNTFPTIAVLGNGVDKIYPSSHNFLASKILERNGVILSHFPPGTPPLAYNFLDRNRIITGLSKIVIVAQAALKSGALSSARHALEQGKDLLSVVGPVYNEYFLGSNKLIIEGATPLSTIEDFFYFYPNYLKNKNEKIILEPSNKDEKLVFNFIKEKIKVSKKELRDKFKTIDLSFCLLNLESENYIDSEPFGEGGGTYFIR